MNPINEWREEWERRIREEWDLYDNGSFGHLEGAIDFIQSLLTTHSARLVERILKWIEIHESFDEFPEPHIYANDLRKYLADQAIDIVKDKTNGM